jgi:hypothetical protein
MNYTIAIASNGMKFKSCFIEKQSTDSKVKGDNTHTHHDLKSLFSSIKEALYSLGRFLVFISARS